MARGIRMTPFFHPYAAPQGVRWNGPVPGLGIRLPDAVPTSSTSGISNGMHAALHDPYSPQSQQQHAGLVEGTTSGRKIRRSRKSPPALTERPASNREQEKEPSRSPVTPNGPFTCRWQQCAQEYADMTTFVEHVNNDHVAVSHDFLCLRHDCERRKPFSAHYQLVNHVRKHTGHKPFTCLVLLYIMSLNLCFP